MAIEFVKENTKLKKEGIEERLEIKKMTEKQLQDCVSASMMNFGVCPQYAGFKFVRECIIISLQRDDKEKKLNLSRDIYPYIAKQYNVREHTIERDIRFALNKATSLMSIKNIKRMFGDAVCAILSSYEITNKAYIEIMTEYIRSH